MAQSLLESKLCNQVPSLSLSRWRTLTCLTLILKSAQARCAIYRDLHCLREFDFNSLTFPGQKLQRFKEGFKQWWFCSVLSSPLTTIRNSGPQLSMESRHCKMFSLLFWKQNSNMCLFQSGKDIPPFVRLSLRTLQYLVRHFF